jgi:hypothetical protein
MEYGKIFSRAVNVVWQNKFLIILGILAALAGGGSNPMTNYSFGGNNGTGQPGQLPDLEPEAAGLAVGLGIALLCVIILVALVLWAISTVARGGLIAGVDSVERGEKSGFSIAWGAAWKKVWTLLGIGFLPAIPGLVLTVFGFITLGAYLGFSGVFGEDFAAGGLAGLGAPLIVAACIFIPIALVLAILRNFAERACMLENLGVIDSYRRGTRVLMDNLGEAIILFVLQIAIFIALGILLFVPGVILAVCCFLWPLLIVINGAVQAFLSALWTLAWRTWTGATSAMDKAPAAM